MYIYCYALYLKTKKTKQEHIKLIANIALLLMWPLPGISGILQCSEFYTCEVENINHFFPCL